MVKDEKVERRKLACENYGEQMSKMQGEGRRRGRVAVRKEVATHDAKMFVSSPQYVCKIY